jgi:hypothetical protein
MSLISTITVQYYLIVQLSKSSVHMATSGCDLERKTVSMIRNTLAILGVLAVAAGPALAADSNHPTVAASALQKAPPGAPYEKVSQAIKGLPDFIPTMGIVYVDPKNLPEGPYLGYSRGGKLVDTVSSAGTQSVPPMGS